MARTLFADLLVVLHLAIAAFIAAGLLLVPVGGALGWRWVRGRALRLAHLAAMLVVTAETVAGVACPLTLWEAALRGVSPREDFVERLVHRILFYELPPWVFGAAYLAGALLAAALWWAVPPTPRRRKTRP